MLIYLVVLFVALTPGILLKLPKGGSKLTVAAVHGLVFALVWHLTHKFVLRAVEGFQGGPSVTPGGPPATPLPATEPTAPPAPAMPLPTCSSLKQMIANIPCN